jgi:hypothetical protein
MPQEQHTTIDVSKMTAEELTALKESIEARENELTDDKRRDEFKPQLDKLKALRENVSTAFVEFEAEMKQHEEQAIEKIDYSMIREMERLYDGVLGALQPNRILKKMLKGIKFSSQD